MRIALLLSLALVACSGQRAAQWNKQGVKLLAEAETVRPRYVHPGSSMNLIDDPAIQAMLKSGKPVRDYGTVVKEAVVAFSNAVAIAPKDAESHYNLATALRMQGLYAAALTEYSEAVRLDASYRDASFQMERLSRYLRANEIDAQADAIADALMSQAGR